MSSKVAVAINVAVLTAAALALGCSSSNGSRARCVADTNCPLDSRCIGGICQKDAPLPPSCSNGKLDGDETDFDCGGSCRPCASGKICKVPSDCQAKACVSNRCAAPQVAWGAVPQLTGTGDDSCTLTIPFTANPPTTQGAVTAASGVTISNVSAAAGTLSAQLSKLATGPLSTSVSASDSFGQTNTLSRTLSVASATVSITAPKAPAAALNQDATPGRQPFLDAAVPTNLCRQSIAGSRGSITLGVSHACVVTTDGKVNCWGGNGQGQVGLVPSPVPSPSPILTPVALSCNSASDSRCTAFSTLSGVVAISAGDNHTCALTTAGNARCWGNSVALGRTVTGATYSVSPAFVCASEATVPCQPLGQLTAIAAGSSHTCALTDGGTVKCWGDNTKGQLGYPVKDVASGMAKLTQTLPVDVCATFDAAQNKCTQLANIVAIAGGGLHTCAITQNAQVLCWGSNQFGQLGNGPAGAPSDPPTPVDSAVPVAVVCDPGSPIDCSTGKLTGAVALALGDTHSCALMQSGRVKCWGNNSSGQLGSGQPFNAPNLSPKTVVCASPGTPGCAAEDRLLNTVAAIAADGFRTCALLANGGVKCWGTTSAGGLGNGEVLTMNSLPVDVQCGKGGDCGPNQPLLTSAVAVTAGRENDDVACVLTASGGVRCWGSNVDGVLGNGKQGSSESSAVPVDVVCPSSGSGACSGNFSSAAVRSFKAFSISPP